jgi:hypothetical protein
MGYETVTSLRNRASAARARKLMLTLALLIAFVASLFPNQPAHAMPPAEAHAHHATASDHHAAHEQSAAHHDKQQHPCDDGDCDCEKSPLASCCAQSASAAAIWVSTPLTAHAAATRDISTQRHDARSHTIDPPTPPPRSVS